MDLRPETPGREEVRAHIMRVHDLPTPALLIDAGALERNLASLAALRPGPALRPHVKAHKCSALAAMQAAVGHRTFTCATPREVLGMAAAGLGDDLLLANETIDAARLAAMARADAMVTVAVDSTETVIAAARAGIEYVLIDVDIGLPRCGCQVSDAGRLADEARSAGMVVRGVMGYEGHLMMVDGVDERRRRVALAVDRLLEAHAAVGGDVISAGGTGTVHLHDRVTEVQAGSYALMDSHYTHLDLGFEQACFVLGTVISRTGGGRPRAVVDVGLKALGMDHGPPTLRADRGVHGDVWFVSDEHLSIGTDRPVEVDDRAWVIPAHIDPTMAMHEQAWLVDGDEVLDRWPIDLRGW